MQFEEVNIETLENSFVQDYEFWKKILDEINNTIDQTTENTQNIKGEKYTYDEFCSNFLNEMIEQEKSYPDKRGVVKIELSLQNMLRKKFTPTKLL